MSRYFLKKAIVILQFLYSVNRSENIFYEKVTSYRGEIGTSFGFNTVITKYSGIKVGAPRADEIIIEKSGKSENPRRTTIRQHGNRWRGKVFTCYLQKNATINCDNGENLNYKNFTNLSKTFSSKNINDEINDRYFGQNLDYFGQTLIECAPASFTEETSKVFSQKRRIVNTGACLVHVENVRNITYSVMRNPKLEVDGLQAPSKHFGHSSSYQNGKIIFSAPISYNEAGSLQITTFDGFADRIAHDMLNKNWKMNKLVSDTFSSSDFQGKTGISSDEYTRLGNKIVTFTCDGNRETYIATPVSTNNGVGSIFIFKYTNSGTITSETVIKPENPVFGMKFGFSIIIVTVEERPFLLVSSPFEGRLDLYDVCQNNENANWRIETPRTVNKLFGYSSYGGKVYPCPCTCTFVHVCPFLHGFF